MIVIDPARIFRNAPLFLFMAAPDEVGIDLIRRCQERSSIYRRVRFEVLIGPWNGAEWFHHATCTIDASDIITTTFARSNLIFLHAICHWISRFNFNKKEFK